MWFRNLYLYRLTGGFELSPEELHQRLMHEAFRPCGSLDMSTLGWVPPLGPASEQLVHAANGRMLVCARREEKLLPASVVREFVAAKVADIEEEQARTVRRRERDTIRDEVVFELLPRAFTRSSLIHAYVSAEDGWLVVDAASAKKAEELTGLLRTTLGSLPAVPPAVLQAPASVMTAWLDQGDVPPDLSIGDECELRDTGEEGGIVRCKRQDLGGDEIRAHLDAGKQAVRLAVTWDERISCLLGEDLAVRRLRFTDLVQEQIDGDDDLALFDSEFSLMTLELARFLPRLLALFGGEDRAASGNALTGAG